MTVAAVLPLPVEEATQPPKARRVLPGLGLVASLALHGAVLASIVGWGGGQVEPPASVEVAVVMEAELEAPVPVPVAQPPIQPSALPVVPPCPPPQPTAHPARSTPRHQAPTMQRTVAVPPGSPSSDAKPSATPEPVATGTAAPATQDGAPHGQQGPADTSSGVEGDGDTGGRASDGSAAPYTGNSAPAYPVAARRAGREGRTVLLVTVGVDGECRDAQLEETSGTPSLDEAAVTTVRHWRFTPARHAGQAVEATIRVPVVFRLTAAAQ